jgi:carnitine O-acetyltransferase
MPSSTTSVRTFAVPKSLNESLAQRGQPQMAYENGRSMDKAKEVSESFSKDQKMPLANNRPKHEQGITFAAQDRLPKLPIPDLDHSMKEYLAALKPLQSPRDHAETQQAVDEFLKSEGPDLQEKLNKYANGKTSYIEQFCKCDCLATQ